MIENLHWERVLWWQFTAAIDVLDSALLACPDEMWAARLWDGPSKKSAA